MINRILERFRNPFHTRSSIKVDWFSVLVAILVISPLLVIFFGLNSIIPMQFASWFGFVLLLIIPGMLLTLIVASPLNLDWIERIAIAYPIGVATLSISGLAVLILHLNVDILFLGWLITTISLFVIFLVLRHKGMVRVTHEWKLWRWDEIILFVLITAGFVYAWSALTAYKIDGDLYTFLGKVSDALAGLPIGDTEFLFGTDIWIGLRSAFNQNLPIWALWSRLSGIDPINLTGYTSRAPLALWAIFSSYFLGKQARGGSRRFGLFTAAIQMLIYLASPFIRSDNVSSFFLTRTNADKFTVAVTMLPVVFALSIYYIRENNRRAWILAGIATFSVSVIHPLTAAMLALGIVAFGGFHWLLHLRSKKAFKFAWHLSLLAVIIMAMPTILFIMSITRPVMASTFPENFEGWAMTEELTTALPLVKIRNLNWYGPIPDLANLEPSDAFSEKNPFLIWRYFLNMRRQHLIVFDINRYIVHPSIFLEPPFILALILLPLLLWRLRSDLGSQYAISNTLALLFVMFNPIITPIVGNNTVPWLLWRFIWMLPYALIIAIASSNIVEGVTKALMLTSKLKTWQPFFYRFGLLSMIVLTAAFSIPKIQSNILDSQYQSAGPRIFPTPEKLLNRINDETTKSGHATVAADQKLSVSIVAYDPYANIIAHRIFNTSEFFPIEERDVALERLIDQSHLFHTNYLTEESIKILNEYDAKFIVASSGGNLDIQLRLLPQWFEWVLDDEGYSLYRIIKVPSSSDSIRANTSMAERDWITAETIFLDELEKDNQNTLALIGLAAIERTRGNFNDAISILNKDDLLSNFPVVHYLIGRLYIEQGELAKGIDELKLAIEALPNIPKFHLDLADACLANGDMGCAKNSYSSASTSSDEVSNLINIAQHWNRNGYKDLYANQYEEIVALAPSVLNRIYLASAYQNAERYEEAEKVLRELEQESPFSGDIQVRLASLKLAENDVESALVYFKKGIYLQDLQMFDTTQSRMALTRTYLDNHRLQEAWDEISYLLTAKPNNAAVHMLLGNFYSQRNQSEEAVKAFKNALQFDPTQVSAYSAISQQLAMRAALDENLDLLSIGIEKNPNQPTIFFALGDKLQRLGDIDAAIDAYQLSIDMHDSIQDSPLMSQLRLDNIKASAYSRLGSIYEDLGRMNTAENYYQAAVATSPSNPAHHVTLGQVQRRSNQFESSENSFRQAIKTDPEYLKGYLQLADLLQSQGDELAAEELFKEALNIFYANPENLTTGVMQLGLQLVNNYSVEDFAMMGSIDIGQAVEMDSIDSTNPEILTTFTSILEQNENSESAVQTLALIYDRMGESDKAIEIYHSAIADSYKNNVSIPTISQYYNGLGDIYAGHAQYNQAIEAYNNAINLEKNNITAKLGLSRMISIKGDPIGSYEILKDAVQISPGSISAQIAHAETLNSLGDLEAASDIYEQLGNKYLGNSQANLALARNYQFLNQFESSETVYKNFIYIVPNEGLAYVGLSNLYNTQAKYQKALIELEKAIEINQFDFDAYFALGQLHTKTGEFDEAIIAYERALKIQPRNLSAYTGLSSVYQLIGENSVAAEILTRAIDLETSTTAPVVSLYTLYQNQNLPDKAQEVVHDFLNQYSESLDFSSLAELYRLIGDSQTTLENLRLSAEENPDSMLALIAYANELSDQGYPEQAEKFYGLAEDALLPSSLGFRSLASVRENQGDIDKAIELLERSILLSPNDALNWLQKSAIQRRQGDPESALKSLERAIEISPNQGRIWHALGDTYLSSGEHEQDLQAFYTGIQVDPTYMPTYGSLLGALSIVDQRDEIDQVIKMGRENAPGNYILDLYISRILSQEGNFKEAQAVISDAISKAPGVARPYQAMGALHKKAGEYEKAVAFYQQALEHNPTDPSAQVALAGIYRILNQEEEAVELLLQASDQYPTAVEPLLALSSIYQDQNNYKEAIQLMHTALERSPGNITVHTNLSGIYRNLAQYNLTLEQLKIASEENPDSMAALVAYADELELQGKTTDAETAYLAAESFNLPTTQGYRALAAARENQADYEKALLLLDKAIELDPKDPLDWVQKARIQDVQGDEDEALISFNKAIAIAPTQGNLKNSLASALIAWGLTDEAIPILEEAITVDPTYLPAYGTLIDAFISSGQTEKATEVALKAQDINPGSYMADIYLSQILLEQKRYAEAIISLDDAIAKSPGSVNPHISKARFYSRLGNNGKALESYQAAMRIDPNNELVSSGIEEISRRYGLTDEIVDIMQAVYYISAIDSIADLLEDKSNQLSEVDNIPQNQHRSFMRLYCNFVNANEFPLLTTGLKNICQP